MSAPYLALKASTNFSFVGVPGGLVVVPGHEVTGDVLGADALDLFLGDGDRDDRHVLAAVMPAAAQLLEERDVAVAVERVEDGVRLGRLDLVDHRAELGVAERRVLLADDLHAVGRGVGLDLLVRGAREHVVAADQEDLLLALLLQVVEAGDDLLVRGGAGVEDVRARSPGPRTAPGTTAAPCSPRRPAASPCGWPRSSRRRRWRPCPREISFCAFSAKVGQSEAPSSTTGSSFLPSTPPAALISSMAMSSEFLHRHLADRHRAAQRVEDADLDRRRRCRRGRRCSECRPPPRR